MLYLREASEDEMILVFLKGEINSIRFQSQIHEVLHNLKMSVEIIDKADLNNLAENIKRREILKNFRGYKNNTDLFENFPDISRWILAECSNNDINKIRYINYSYWNELSKHTSSPLIAAETIHEGIEIYGISNSSAINGVDFLVQGGTFPPIILLTSDKETYIILEGHSRMTVYGLAPHFFSGSKCYIGFCEESALRKWNGYCNLT